MSAPTQPVEPGLDPEVDAPLGLPQLGRVRERGLAVRVNGQPHQGIPGIAGADGGQLGRRGQPRPGQPGPACRSRAGHRPGARPRCLQPGGHHQSFLPPRAPARALTRP
jgi:hypothetical protein